MTEATSQPTEEAHSPSQEIPSHATVLDPARFYTKVLVPIVATDAIIRRPFAMAVADRMKNDRSAIT